MLYATPRLTPERLRKLEEVRQLREGLVERLRPQTRWVETVRRLASAEVTAASVSVDGFRVSPSEALAIEDRPASLRDEDYHATRGYEQAMDWIESVATDPHFEWSISRINNLHWLASHLQPGTDPGRLRTGNVSVTGWDGRVVYEGPPPDEVPGLVQELVDRLRKPDGEVDEIVQAAMAHIDLLAIHPYQGGNGRVARLLQSLVLAWEGRLTPELGSIEVYLGSHAQGYREALHSVHGPTFNPKRDASKWLDFCLEAHRQEALRLMDRLDLSEAQAHLSTQLVSRQRFPERFAIPLQVSLAGLEVRNESYRHDAAIAVATSKQDLGRLVDAGWLTPEGGGRNAHYVASDRLTSIWGQTRQALLRQQELMRKRGADDGLTRSEQREIQLVREAIEQHVSATAAGGPAAGRRIRRASQRELGR